MPKQCSTQAVSILGTSHKMRIFAPCPVVESYWNYSKSEML